MSIITIANLNHKKISAHTENTTVLDIIHENYIDWMHTCGKKGNCTTCKMNVIQGMENLSELSRNEEKFRQLGRLKEGERLACQSILKGDITIAVPHMYKLPHLKYSDEP